MNRHPRAALLRMLVISVICVAGLLALLHAANRPGPGLFDEVRETGNRAFMEEGIVTWNGQKYRKKPALTMILLCGIDRTAPENGARTSSYRNGGQADFLLLLAIDHGNRQIADQVDEGIG